jgi:hypothetical protein
VLAIQSPTIELDAQQIMMLALTESMLKSRNVAPRDYCYKPEPRAYIHDALASPRKRT